MQLTARALWTIERNFGSDLTLRSIAEACGVSPFHLAHAFGATTGKSVMSYVRGRRLTEAARALADGAPDILSIALVSGYASHEAFTRAFRDQFGTTPETVKRNASLSSLPLVQPIELTEGKPAMPEEPKIVSRGAMTFIGLVERQAFDKPHLIPLQWQKFMAMYGFIEKKVSEIPVGLSFNLDDEGTFDYACAVEIARDAETPKGLHRISVAPQTYAVFEHRAHVALLGNTYREIWNSWLTDHNKIAADAPSLERHKETFDPRTGEGGIDIWIPIKS
ncbi:MAG TPA: AraC family transcriptional regulator [Rhizomicrobium sp.]|jgi:AraC family transcriptional regulator|nr:AraC family transcriptional regulator [Rhizomicrobium sp.]